MALALALALTAPGDLRAQDRAAEEAYVRVVSETFRIAPEEVGALVQAGTGLEELPVVLRMSRYSGIPPTVLVALRRRGDSWLAVAGRYQLGAGMFHVAIPEGQLDDTVRRAHELFRDTPEARWNSIALSDVELVALANLHLLARATGSAPGRILEARSRAGSFPGALRLLAGRS